MAEALLNRLGEGRFRAHSAGTHPRAAVHPMTLALLRDKGFDVTGLHSKTLDAFAGPAAPQMDFVFTVCDRAANEECPAWPGHPLTAHWGLADPARATGSAAERQLAFQQAYGVLQNRLQAFTALPVATLDRLRMQGEIDRIAALQG
jgi:arsenate reductase